MIGPDISAPAPKAPSAAFPLWDLYMSAKPVPHYVLRQVLDAGANAIVAGSHVFHAPDYGRAISSIRKSVRPRP